MKKNFSQQPLDTTTGGVQVVLTGTDLMSDIPKQSMNRQIFNKSHLFKQDCYTCYNASGKRNSDGYGYGDAPNKITGVNVLDTLKLGLQTWSSSQQRKADAEAAAAALQLAQIQRQNEAIKLQQQKEKTSAISKYTVPILIGGGVVILGIITYFVFKKKKIS